jgi:hypothetical protein
MQNTNKNDSQKLELTPNKITQTEAPTTARSTRWAVARLTRLLFFTLLALYIFTLGGHLYSGDGVASYNTARSLLDGQGGALENYFPDPRFGITGRDGHFFSKYGLGQVIIDLPFVGFIKFLGRLAPGLEIDPISRMFLSSLNGFVVAFSALLLYKIVRLFGFGVRAGIGVALLYGVGTMAWMYARLDFSEPLLALFYLLLARALFAWKLQAKPDTELLKAGLWLAISITVKPTAALILLPVLLYIILVNYSSNQKLSQKNLVNRLLKTTWRPAFYLALPLVGAGIILLAYNYYRFGSFTETGYSAIKDQFVLGSVYGGVYGFLLSPGKSIFLYSPGLIFALFGVGEFYRQAKLRAEFLFSLALTLTYLLFFSLFWNWDGDWTWGPRYLLPTFPFMVLWAAPLFQKFGRIARHGFYLSICGALAANGLGILAQFDQYFQASYDLGVNRDWRFIPELSPLRAQLYMLASAVSRALGRPALTLDFIDWETEREHAIRRIIPLDGYDFFDIWWLRPLSSGGWIITLLMSLFFGWLVWLAWKRFYQTYQTVKEFEQY